MNHFFHELTCDFVALGGLACQQTPAYIAHLHQEPFQLASLEDCRMSELCPPGAIRTPG